MWVSPGDSNCDFTLHFLVSCLHCLKGRLSSLPHFLPTEWLPNHRHSAPVHTTPLKPSSQTFLVAFSWSPNEMAFARPSCSRSLFCPRHLFSEFHLPGHARGYIVTTFLSRLLIFLLLWFYFLLPPTNVGITPGSILRSCSSAHVLTCPLVKSQTYEPRPERWPWHLSCVLVLPGGLHVTVPLDLQLSVLKAQLITCTPKLVDLTRPWNSMFLKLNASSSPITSSQPELPTLC